MQELARFETQRIAGRPQVDQFGAGAEHGRESLVVGRLSPRVGQDPDQGVAIQRWSPVHAPDVDGLRREGIRQKIHPNGHDARFDAEVHGCLATKAAAVDAASALER
jgi:hypothetical protein